LSNRFRAVPEKTSKLRGESAVQILEDSSPVAKIR
jgi:hypothetical protein